MNVLKVGALGILVLHMFGSCKKNKDKNPELKVSTTVINASAAAGKSYLEITSNVDWKLTGLPAGISANPSSGSGNAKVEIIYPANESFEPVKSDMLIEGNGVASVKVGFTQLGAAAAVLFDQSHLNFSSSGSYSNISVTSNVKWKLEEVTEVEWLDFNTLTGEAGVTSIRVSVSSNTSGRPRSAKLKLSGTERDATPVEMLVTQEQADIVITAVTAKAKGGSTIFIDGSGFTENKDNLEVFVNGQKALINGSSFTTISLVVPPKCGSGKVEIKVGNKQVTGPDFEYDWVWVTSTLTLGGSYSLDAPGDLVVDPQGNIYVVEMGLNRIMKITPDNRCNIFAGDPGGAPGILDGIGEQARFNTIKSIMYNEAARQLLVSDYSNKAVRKVSTLDAAVTTWNGLPQLNVLSQTFRNGKLCLGFANPGLIAEMNSNNTYNKLFENTTTNPMDMVTDNEGNIYICDASWNSIRKISSAGLASVWVGSTSGDAALVDGTTTGARLYDPRSIAIGKNGNLFVADAGNNAIRMISSAGVVTTIAGDGVQGSRDGEGKNARFSSLSGITVAENGDIYVSDYKRIRKISYQ